MLGSNFALLVRSPGDDGQQLLTTGSRLVCISLTGEHLLPGWAPINVVMFIVKIGNVKGSTISQYDEVA